MNVAKADTSFVLLSAEGVSAGPAAKAGAAEQSKASDRAEPAKVFFIFIVNTPFLFLIQLYYYILC
ncbi:hypothetical protein BAPNAU_1706 [Bacillus velezensis NAU-B3]|nr:hypothetical protein EFW58_00020 [Bacillus velezensis]CDH95487.1 hypothetical protein BAPNAU_1706 [Bacillus velezensis NAU-B3]